MYTHFVLGSNAYNACVSHLDLFSAVEHVLNRMAL